MGVGSRLKAETKDKESNGQDKEKGFELYLL